MQISRQNIQQQQGPMSMKDRQKSTRQAQETEAREPRPEQVKHKVGLILIWASRPIKTRDLLGPLSEEHKSSVPTSHEM